jgi:NAD(P)-dependent dehydrogenase (short-subunit alcohol dehydrogenase family)
MPSRKKSGKDMASKAQPVHSKDMDPLPKNFGPFFFQNQFRTKIELLTTEKYPDVRGKYAIITGSNTGLGFESVRQLLSLGTLHLVMGMQSLKKDNTAASKLHATNSSTKIEVWELNMESYNSIQAFVCKCQDNLSRIDIAILNAGLSPLKFATTTATGHEKTIQVNYISTVLLAVLLLAVLKSKANGQNLPRLTLVNSIMSHLCKFPNINKQPLLPSFNDTAITLWNSGNRYGVSKLPCQFFIIKLAEKVNPEDIIINIVDPGLTKTDLFRDVTGGTAVTLKLFLSTTGRPVDRGAATYINAVLRHGKESHGCFLMNCKIVPYVIIH